MSMINHTGLTILHVALSIDTQSYTCTSLSEELRTETKSMLNSRKIEVALATLDHTTFVARTGTNHK